MTSLSRPGRKRQFICVRGHDKEGASYCPVCQEQTRDERFRRARIGLTKDALRILTQQAWR